MRIINNKDIIKVMDQKIMILCGFVFATIMVAVASAEVNAAPDSCYDSDGGNYSSYYVKGSVSGILNGHEYEFTDSCMTNTVENDSLEEWFCDGTIPKAMMYIPCPFNCVDGACVQNFTITTTTTTPPISTPASCEDTDGLDAYTKGAITGWFGMHNNNYTYTDECINSAEVREYFCRYNAGFQESLAIDCADGYHCDDGRCTASNGTAEQCIMPGNKYPCNQATLQEVLDSITGWIGGDISLGDVIKLIISWIDPVSHPPD